MQSAGRTEPGGRPQQLLLLGCLVCVAAVTPLKRMGPETEAGVRVQGRRGLKSGTGKGILTAPHSSPRKTSPGSLALSKPLPCKLQSLPRAVRAPFWLRHAP